MTLPQLQPSRTLLGVIVLLCACLLGGLGMSFNKPQPLSLAPFILDSHQCSTGSHGNEDAFVAFITDRSMTYDLLEVLCQHEVISRQYGQVTIRWSHSDEETIQYVGKGIADLALLKPNLMEAFATQSTHGYQEVAHYPDYTTYLISLKEKPQISKEYLWGKRIGLLDYPSSRSGHIVPKRMLNELNMKESDVEVIYASSHAGLRELLSSNKVDVISSYWHKRDIERFSANYKTPIESNISGSKWYLKLETANTDLVCAVQQALAKLARASASEYYSQLALSPACAGVKLSPGELK